MNINIKQVFGKFTRGYALDKHSLYSIPIGENEQGRMQFDTKRTEAGEAVFQLKYRNDQDQVLPLAQAVVTNIVPLLPKFSLIVPMPASNPRAVQPVTSVAQALGDLLNKPVFEEMLSKAPRGQSLKDLHTREEKDRALINQITVNDVISGNGKWDMLLVDDLYHSGASIDAACQALRTYEKIGDIYVATLTWR